MQDMLLMSTIIVEELEKSKKSNWTALMISFSFVSTFIYIWFYNNKYGQYMRKKFTVLTAELEGYKYRIEEDLPEVGWYIYCYDSNGKLTHDYIQDTEEFAKEFCLEKFGLAKNQWK